MPFEDAAPRKRWDRDPLFRIQLALILLAILFIIFLAWRWSGSRSGWDSGSRTLGGPTVSRVRSDGPPAIEPRKKLTLKRLLALIKENTSPEAAQRGLAIVAAEPKLKEALGTQAEDEPLDDFLQRVGEAGALPRVLEKMMEDPGLQLVLARAADEPEIRRLLGRSAASAAGAPAGTAVPLGSVGLARRPAVGGGVGGRGGPGRASSRGGAAGAVRRGMPLRTASLVPRSAQAGGERETGPAGSAPEAQTAPGGGLIHAQGLEGVKGVGPSRDLAQFIASSFSDMPKPKRDKLMDQCFQYAVCDIYAACAKADLVDDCNKTCEGSPNCKGKMKFTEAAGEKAAGAGSSIQWGGGTRCCPDNQKLVSCVDVGSGRNHGVTVAGNCCTAFEGRRNYGGPGGLLTCR